MLQLSSNDLLRANILNRLAYGPTPDELARVALLGAQAYIDEQLQPQNIPDTFDAYSAVPTNASTSLQPPIGPCFGHGIVSQFDPLHVFASAGDIHLDDIRLQLVITNINCVTNITPTATNITCTTNFTLGPNLLSNGGFEAPLNGNGTNSWRVSSNLPRREHHDMAYEGSQSLHMVASVPGTTQASAIWQTIQPTLTVNRRCVLSFAYVQEADSSN